MAGEALEWIEHHAESGDDTILRTADALRRRADSASPGRVNPGRACISVAPSVSADRSRHRDAYSVTAGRVQAALRPAS